MHYYFITCLISFHILTLPQRSSFPRPEFHVVIVAHVALPLWPSNIHLHPKGKDLRFCKPQVVPPQISSVVGFWTGGWFDGREVVKTHTAPKIIKRAMVRVMRLRSPCERGETALVDPDLNIAIAQAAF